MSNFKAPRARTAAWIANLALVVTSLLLTFALLEVAVRLFVDFEQQKPSGVYDVDHESGGLSFLPGRSRRYETSEFSFEAHYNRFGRRDVEWPLAVVSDPKSVLVIGDSLVYGIGVDHRGTISSVLEERFAQARHPVEVMNFGMPGNVAAPRGYALMLDDAIAKGFAARTVVVAIFVGNDFYPNQLDPQTAESAFNRSNGDTSLLTHWKSFELLTLRVSQSARMVGWVLTLGRMVGVSVYDGAGTYVFLRKQTPEQEALVHRILSHIGHMKRRCDETGRRLFAVILPNRIQVENREALSSGIYDATRPDRDVLRYCEEIAISCLDLLPVLNEAYRDDGEPLFYPVDRHPNPRGYRLIGETLAQFLLAEGVP